MGEKGYSGLLLRLGLSLLFLYFGIDKLSSIGSSALTFERLWLVSLVPLSATTTVVIAGVIELVICAGLLSGIYNKGFSLSAAFWAFLILLQLGYPAGIYDAAIVLMALALYFTGPGMFSSNKFK